MRGSIVSVLLLGALTAASAGVITLTNNTGGWDFTDIYVTSFCARSWGENRIADSTLSEGEQWILEVPAGIYNIRLVDTDGDTYTRTGVPVMESLDWAVTLDDLDGAPQSGQVYSG